MNKFQDKDSSLSISLSSASKEELLEVIEKQKLELEKLTSGGFMAAKLHNELAEIPAEERDVDEIKDGYQLKFIGKDYAKLQAGLKTETVITPDFEHNSKPENQNSENIFITGDNLDALKHLEHAYSGKVDVIYIDPPYNTGNDGFVYADNFKLSDEDLKEKIGLNDAEISRVRALDGKSSHSAWLTFMLPRLMIAKRLLSDTGVIFISIDDNEQASLKNIMDEIFGEQNFEYQLSVVNNLNGNDNSSGMMETQEYCLVYSKKTSNFSIGVLPVEDEEKNEWEIDEKGYWKLGGSLKATGINAPRSARPNLFFPIYIDEDTLDWSLEPRVGIGVRKNSNMKKTKLSSKRSKTDIPSTKNNDQHSVTCQVNEEKQLSTTLNMLPRIVILKLKNFSKVKKFSIILNQVNLFSIYFLSG